MRGAVDLAWPWCLSKANLDISQQGWGVEREMTVCRGSLRANEEARETARRQSDLFFLKDSFPRNSPSPVRLNT